MHQRFCSSDLVPRGFVVDDVVMDGATALITVRVEAKSCVCPGCGARSDRIHSRYRWRLADLAIAGRPVRLMVLARRFYCKAVLCGRRVFVERFDPDILAPWARRTTRLNQIVRHLGLALGGRPAANFARRLMVPVDPAPYLPLFISRIRSPVLRAQTKQMYGRGKPDLLQARVIGAT